VPIEVLRLPRVGKISITSTEVGTHKPMMTETLRTGLTLKSHETATIQQGESTTLATGMRLRSFKGDRIRSTQSALGPVNKEMIRANTRLLPHEDHDTDIKFTITNLGENPYTVTLGDYIGRLIMLGMDEVIVEFAPMEDKAHEIMAPIDNKENDMIQQTKLGELENALAAPTIPTNKTWKEHQKHGGPETTKLYDPDAVSPEPSGVFNRSHPDENSICSTNAQARPPTSCLWVSQLHYKMDTSVRPRLA
jgi:dUTPase